MCNIHTSSSDAHPSPKRMIAQRFVAKTAAKAKSEMEPELIKVSLARY
jgi:hypothetical protein